MKQIVVLTPRDASPGFALTGVRQMELTPERFWPTLHELEGDPAIGVLAVDSRLVDDEGIVKLRAWAETWSGVMVTLPPPEGGTSPVEDELKRLVQRALGYHVRLEGG